ncbi:MAG: NAD(P)H-dependent oxidoreductase [Flavobacteriaceae bacterium]|nr:NAD(P)H-dependent oxidoreductase [Flavobacteriaceae bacterium]
MNILTSLEWRYATKKFDSKKILSKNQIDTLKEAFNLTATSYGLQPIKMLVIQNKQLQKELISHTMNQTQVGDASHVLVICVQDKLTENDIENYFKLVKKGRNTSDDVLNPFKAYLKESLPSKTTSEIFSWGKNQAYLALGNLLTVAAAEKIDSCPMEGFNPDKYSELLNLKEHHITPVLVLPVGFRAKDDFMKDLVKIRKKITDVIIEIN